MITPSNPNPTTAIPITAPPLNATPKALCIPCCSAAVAVLEFESVALFIPIIPAEALNIAPKMNANPVSNPNANPIAGNAIITNIRITKYSFFKNAVAPSLINPDISATLSFPTGAFITCL